jgi:hypothetical protein
MNYKILKQIKSVNQINSKTKGKYLIQWVNI